MSYDMSPEERRELVSEFLNESESHLQVLNEKLLQAENAGKAGKEIPDTDMNALFRAAHTIKGTASFIGFSRVVRLTHEMETILQKIKNAEVRITQDIIDVLFAGVDRLEKLFDSLRTFNEERHEVDDCVAKFHALSGAASAATPATPPRPEPAAAGLPEAMKNSSPFPAVGVNRRYLEEYLVETEQNILDFNEKMLAYERELPGTGAARETIHELFRIVHTIKGSSALVHVRQAEEIAHRMENSFAIIRETGWKLESERVTLMFEAIDTIKDIVEILRKGKDSVVEIGALCERLDRCQRELKEQKDREGTQVSGARPPAPPAAAAAPVIPSSSGEGRPAGLVPVVIDLAQLTPAEQALALDSPDSEQEIYHIAFELESGIPLKSMKILLCEQRLEQEGQIIAWRPDMDTLDRVGEDAICAALLFATVREERKIRELLLVDGVRIQSVERIDKSLLAAHRQPAAVAVAVAEMAQDAPMMKKGDGMVETVKVPEKEAVGNAAPIEVSTIRIDARKLDTLMNLSGELVIARAQFARLVSLFEKDVSGQRQISQSIKEVKNNADRITKDVKGFFGVAGQSRSEEMVRKIQKELDDLAQHLQFLESNICRNDIINRIRMLDETTSSLGKISSDIQSGVMQTRMIPIEGVFTRFKRIVRDIAKDMGKQVNLNIEGEDTELDKNIVDKLGDPLTHMIRNAIDHGIEDVAARRAQGKPEEGTLLLKAAHKGNTIWISLTDDGRGLDKEKIVSVAIKKGLITAEQAERMSDLEKYELIFLPGFSTADKVTNLSGRGVGMDVVKTMINSVNGAVDIETEKGKGTTIVLKIPLTLAIIQALLVRIGTETYAFPLDAVTEIIRAAQEEIHSVDGNPAVKLRSHVLSLVDLRVVMKIRGDRTADGAGEKVKIVVITDGNNTLGVMVDSLIGEEEIVIKSLSEHFSQVNGISGASILGDGTVALILDPIAIIKES
ncbi:MAG: Hpt domain-containing protein [Candidatus Omnitrophica bacterium]|nr:Hpt domain-containing protein [Candidatus Omnitrophota bacterium]